MNILTQFVGAASVGTLVYLYITNNVFRYYIKHTLVVIALTTCASAFIPFMLLRPMNYKNSFLPCWTLKHCGRLLGVRCIVHGRENLVKDGACVVLMNHQSIVDLLVLGEVWPILGRATMIAKKEIFYMWPFGLAVWLWGTIFIDRLSGDKAKATINQTARTVCERKAKLVMFPEGTRHGGENLLPFKKGAFHVALSCNLPLQPIITSKYYFLNSEEYIFDRGIVNVNILPPIPTTDMKKEDLDTLMSRTYDIMNDEYHHISEETMKIQRRKEE